MESAEPRLVLGTAGHIDHGKTALIRALTGVDTDRLPEEKARGITIELGFAPLDLPGGPRLGVVDVPGHERLVRTMVAGATGIDLMLLVIAADEGVMPQTREHVAICELLGVSRGVVALTKVDAASDDLVELAEVEAAELLEGTRLAAAPIVRVSALRGEGLDELREALRKEALGADSRPQEGGAPRLPVDRCFALRGFGTVVTGTLAGGAFEVGATVELLPSARRARVRGLQSHGVASERVEAGARCAVNLQGIEVEEVSRGQVLTLPGALEPTATFDARLRWLDVAPACDADEPVSVELLAGTAERRARVAPIGAQSLAPGTEGLARLHVDGEPVPVLPGDRFVLRGFARTAMGGATLGGGTVLDVAPPHRRRGDPELARQLEVLGAGDVVAGLEVRIARGGLAGVSRECLRRETGLGQEALAAALEALRDEARACPTASDCWLAAEAVATLESRLVAALEDFHHREPIQPGMPTGALRGSLPENVPAAAAELALERLAAGGGLVIDGDRVRRPDHRARLDGAQQALVERVLPEAASAGLEAPGLREWAERLGVDSEALRAVLNHLTRERALVHAPGDLWFDRAVVDALRAKVVDHLREHGALETPAYKALIGTSRRTAVPLMELFDAEHLTTRRADKRLPGPAFPGDVPA